jgi:hypothetical protein
MMYRVYECVEDCFDYDPALWYYNGDDLGEAHTLAYTKWKLSLRERAFTVIQPYDDSCRGHYGVKNYDYGDEE